MCSESKILFQVSKEKKYYQCILNLKHYNKLGNRKNKVCISYSENKILFHVWKQKKFGKYILNVKYYNRLKTYKIKSGKGISKVKYFHRLGKRQNKA